MTDIDYSALRFWLNILQLTGICAIGIYTWWTNRERVTNKRFKEHHHRLVTLENQIKYSPTQTQYEALSTRIDRLHGDLREISGNLRGINRAVDLINEYLINQGGKGK